MTFATGDKITFAYDSYGNRIKKTVTQNGTTDVVEYIDGYEYKNNQLKYIAANEGFIKFENNQYHYVYQYKDQVGNVRLTYQDVNKNGVIERTEILNESNYYPFGLKHGYYNQLANNFGNSLLSNESFNGQPSLVDLDANLSLMDFRLYDGALGRFFGIDLLADLFTSHSPYHFAYNNPVSFADPTGLNPTDPPGSLIYDESGSSSFVDDDGLEGVLINFKREDGWRPSPIDNPWAEFSMEIVAPPHTYGGGGGGGSAVNALMPGVNPGLMPHDTGDSVGQPGDWESLIPVWGSGRSAVDHFQRGNYWKGTGHLALAISDVFLVKSIATIGVKGTVIGATKIASKNAAKGGRGLWTLTKEGASAIKNHKTFGTIYKSNSDGLWWAVDKAGHGGSKFKVFKEGKGGLEWFKDADEFGNFIINKHKGSTGTFIPWGQLGTVK